MAAGRWFSKSNIINALVIAGLLSVIFVPGVKTLLIRGLMALGFFNPDLKQAVVPNAKVSNITFSNRAGQVVSLANLKGKVVVINFWATWCPPCRAEMPSLNALYEKFKNDKRLVFIAVDAEADLKKSAAFLQSNGYSLPLYQVVSNVEQSVYSGTLPTTVIINKAGSLVLRHQGAGNYDNKDMVDFLDKLANEK